MGRGHCFQHDRICESPAEFYIVGEWDEIQKMEENKTIKVSDWSQKYKLAIYAVSGIGITTFGYLAYKVLVEIRELLRIIAGQ